MTSNFPRPGFSQVCAVLSLVVGLSACGGASKSSPGPESTTLSGFVGSPSLTDATITLLSDGGATSTPVSSGADASFSLTIERPLSLPVRVRAEGGTDLLSGQANALTLEAMSFDPEVSTLNISHLSTLASLMTGCGPVLDQASLDRSWDRLRELAGLPASLDPSGRSPTPVEVAELMRVNVALAETLVRASQALTSSGYNSSATDVFTAVACDLADDGLLNLSADRTATPAISVFRAAQAAVLLEVVGREPYVAGQQATTLLNDLLYQLTSDSTLDIADLPIPDALLTRARADLALLLADFSDDVLVDMLVALQGNGEQASSAVRSALTSARLTALWTLPERIALADTSLLSRLSDRMTAQPAANPPIVSVSASDTSISTNDTVTLSWASDNADVCRAAGDWTGNRPLDGVETTPPLTRSSSYELTCAGLGGFTNQSLQISVTDGSQPPVVSLSADDVDLQAGEQTVLRWTSTNATACTAADGWTGPQAVLGNMQTGGLQTDTVFSLTCTGPGGSDTATVTVSVSAPPPPPEPAPTLSFTLSSSNIDSGQSVTLNWSVANATSCQAGDGWSGSQPVSGSTSSGALTSTTSYSLTCSGPGGSVSRSRTVTVNAAPPPPQPAPTLSFTLSSNAIDSGQSVTLNWSAANATSCQAGDGWSGSQPVSGSASSGALISTTTYSLTCSGPGGSVSLSRSVTVNAAPPPPAPTVSLNAADTILDPGDTTTLTWSTSDANACTASGGWSSNRSTAGSEIVGPLNAQTTFSLSCSGAGGSALAMIAISVNGTMSLNWVAPTENVDGSALTDLAGYRVYYGEVSRNYPDMNDINDPTQTNTSIALPSGDYYVAMTALDQEGNESAYSNEVLKTVP